LLGDGVRCYSRGTSYVARPTWIKPGSVGYEPLRISDVCLFTAFDIWEEPSHCDVYILNNTTFVHVLSKPNRVNRPLPHAQCCALPTWLRVKVKQKEEQNPTGMCTNVKSIKSPMEHSFLIQYFIVSFNLILTNCGTRRSQSYKSYLLSFCLISLFYHSNLKHHCFLFLF